MSFLSPITPTSTLRQSIPASYVTIDVKGKVDVNVYMDIDGRWVSGDDGSKINWDWATVNIENKAKPKLQQWKIRRETELLLSEIRDRAEWGTFHFTGPTVSLRNHLNLEYCFNMCYRTLNMNLEKQAR